MTRHLITMTTSRAPPILCAALLAALGGACSSSSDAGSNTHEGGLASDGASGASGGTSSDAAPDAQNAPLPDASASDAAAGGPTADSDVSNAADGTNGPDAESTGSPQPVNLGTASGYAILAESAISTVPPSVVTGNVGVSPAAASFITGFALAADATSVFSTSPQVTGNVYAADYAVPTPSNLTTAVGDMQNAFTDAAGRAPDVTELGAGSIGGMTLTRGVYKWSTGLLIPTNLTLDGSGTDVWIFQIAQGLTVSSATSVVLTGGAVAANVFWEVAGAVQVGTTAHLEGTVLGQTAINLATGASINGRLLAQTAVSIDTSVVAKP
jgi:hypothetical protein